MSVQCWDLVIDFLLIYVEYSGLKIVRIVYKVDYSSCITWSIHFFVPRKAFPG